MKQIVLSMFVLAVSGCTWVKLDDAGREVRVAYRGDVNGCRSLGEVSVSVKEKVGPYHRNDLKVRDELESLARNEAATLKADTIRPLDEPADGEQRFGAYACDRARPSETGRPQQNDAHRDETTGNVETFPVKER